MAVCYIHNFWYKIILHCFVRQKLGVLSGQKIKGKKPINIYFNLGYGLRVKEVVLDLLSLSKLMMSSESLLVASFIRQPNVVYGSSSSPK